MPMNSIYNIKDVSIASEIMDINPIQGIVTGYFSKFNNVDSDGDIMKPGAFTKTISEQGPQSAQPRIKHLLNHDVAQPLGKLLTLKEDQYGLYYESQVGTHEGGEDFIKMVESGLITEHSIGFKIIKRNQIQSYENYLRNPQLGQYEITEVKLYEGSSLTAWGANPLTPITSLKGEKNLDVDMIVDKSAAIEKFCRNTTATDDTIQMLLLHSKQLAQLIVDMKSKTTEPDNTIQPVDEVADIIRQFRNKI
ncbi:MAG: HK97 family phage prohead protease [Caulobacteraceae bacterium]|nr:HK97 family phage prohead protease [Caulobacteraceae bacterium]